MCCEERVRLLEFKLEFKEVEEEDEEEEDEEDDDDDDEKELSKHCNK